MVKTIIKEFAIVILMIAAIALLLGILFYDYVPTSKVVPIKVEAYTLPTEIQEEIAKDKETEEQTIVQTYIIDSDELQTYENTKEYKKGKENPFAVTSVGTQSTENTTSNTASNTTSSKSSEASNSTATNDVENTNINSLK